MFATPLARRSVVAARCVYAPPDRRAHLDCTSRHTSRMRQQPSAVPNVPHAQFSVCVRNMCAGYNFITSIATTRGSWLLPQVLRWHSRAASGSRCARGCTCCWWHVRSEARSLRLSLSLRTHGHQRWSNTCVSRPACCVYVRTERLSKSHWAQPLCICRFEGGSGK